MNLWTPKDKFRTSPKDQINVSPRLANTPRSIYFPEEEKFETEDNDAVDRVLKQFERSSRLNVVHRLESRKRYVLLALASLVLFLWGVIRYGVPAPAKIIAVQLPPAAHRIAGRQTLDFLERSVLSPTELDHETRIRLLNRFQQVITNHPGHELTVLFRHGGRIGPNAFALPDGAVVFTDDMMRIAEHDDELVAVLLHEIGHVVHRHGMRTMIQRSLLAFALLAVTGDISRSSDLLKGVPVVLTELAYSRAFEREADRYALTHLCSSGIPPVHFVNLMRRIDKATASKMSPETQKWWSYLSTHPWTKERLRPFQKCIDKRSFSRRVKKRDVM